ncbi:glycosyltransferase family 2 protein [Mucilaginibacter sp. FT3.2]|uniref:glycosyltransferase family 2 protein n=1 Tax=Mucilaginibacter sp. FT3.2 TaxID=2723090 RepID=UPI00160D38C6|nr:glycosyltransferase family A protein [Mucilaginibacter sp. FT3.2]MBB6231310.1 glycosyltransferase involved in cell wall biosynthesis [Mucilaginibacter sp. FT3.2]
MEKIHLTPLVSICIPVYNCESYIDETIESVINQTYKNIEIIVVDDGSTDGTLFTLEKLKTNQISIYYQQNAGAAAARNLAYSKSNGQYIKFLDGDDIINPEMIDSQVNLAIEHQHCIISAKWGRFYNNDLDTFKLSTEDCWQTLAAYDWICSSWKNGHSMTQSGMFLLPKQIIENAGLWNEQLTLIDDLDFFTRVILKCKAVVFDQNSTLYYRSGNGGSLSDRKQAEAMQSAFRAISNATTNLLAVRASAEAKLACANTWQHYIYLAYPKHSKLANEAQKRVDELGGSTLKFMAGGVTQIITGLIGWRATKRIKQILSIN